MNAVAAVPPKMDAAAYCPLGDGSHLAAGFAALGPITQAFDPLFLAGGTPASRVAAEQVAHFIEAWRYGSSALRAYMVNSRENALHFAYYAELRAALSLFAYSGISINQISGCGYLDQAGAFVTFKSTENNRTHPTVWAAWPEWVKRTDAQSLLERMRLAPGVALGDFRDVLAAYAPVGVLTDWGYDLVSGTLGDHTARNNSSYDPLLADAPLFEMTDACVDLVRQIWRSLIRGASGVAFDQDLIIFLADRSVRSIAGESPGHADYLAGQRTMLEAVSARTGVDVTDIEQAINKPYSPALFQYALMPTTQPENVLSRAFFLLRLASIAVEQNLGLPASGQARAWVRNWLTSVGLFPSDGSMDVEDVAADYELSLEQFVPQPPHPRGLWDIGMAEHSSRLSRPEAFISWGLPLSA